jgi:hypothetical protein
MKRLVINTLLSALLLPSAKGQAVIIKDEFDYSKIAFEVTLENKGTETIYLDSVQVKYDWFSQSYKPPIPDSYSNISYFIRSKGAEVNSDVPASYDDPFMKLVIKPTATFSVRIPQFNSGSVSGGEKIALIPNRPVLLSVGVETEFYTHGLAEQLESFLQLHIGPQKLKTQHRKLEREFLLRKGGVLKTLDDYYGNWYTASPPEEQKKPCLSLINEIKSLQASLSSYNPASFAFLEHQIKWLYASKHEEDSIKMVYDLALETQDSAIRLHALHGIRLLRYAGYKNKLEGILQQTNSLEEARACTEALSTMENDYRNILSGRLGNLSTSSAILGFCAMELIKIGYDQLPSLVLNQLANENLTDEDYHRMALAFLLSKNASSRNHIYSLINEKRAWAYSSDKSQEYKFSQLIQIALYEKESSFFTPLIQEILSGGQAGPNTMEVILSHAFQISQLNAGKRGYVSDPFIFWDNILVIRNYGPDEAFFTFHGDNVEVRFKNDDRFRQKIFSYTFPDIDWIDVLFAELPAYKDSPSPWVRRNISLLANSCNPYSGGKKIDDYCQQSNANCRDYLSDGLSAYASLGKEDIGAFLGYFEIDKWKAKSQFKYMEWESLFGKKIGEIFQYYPDQDVRYLAFDLLLKYSFQLKEYFPIALRDTSSEIREMAESALPPFHFPDLDKIVIDNLANASGKNAARSVRAYTRYLGEESFPAIKEILKNPSTSHDLLSVHINNIVENIPPGEQFSFRKELEFIFSNPKNYRLRPLILESFMKYLPPDELIPYLSNSFGSPFGSSIEIGVPTEYLLYNKDIIPKGVAPI